MEGERGQKRSSDEKEGDSKRMKSLSRIGEAVSNIEDIVESLLVILVTVERSDLRESVRGFIERNGSFDIDRFVLEHFISDGEDPVESSTSRQGVSSDIQADMDRFEEHGGTGNTLRSLKKRSDVLNSSSHTPASSRLSEYVDREAESGASIQLDTCSCCTALVYAEDMVKCEKGHRFCVDCITRTLEMRISEGRTQLRCLEFEVVAQYWRRVQSNEISLAGVDNMVYCPHCSYGAVLDSGCHVFPCLNPDCRRLTCRHCHRDNHIPLTCEQMEGGGGEEAARMYNERREFEATLRRCHDCKLWFYKTEGCDIMTCVCGAKQCYRCRQPITEPTHFCTSSSQSHDDFTNQLEQSRGEDEAQYIRDHPEAASFALMLNPAHYSNNPPSLSHTPQSNERVLIEAGFDDDDYWVEDEEEEEEQEEQEQEEYV